MHDCPECGKRMATAGGLEIHIQMAHAPPTAPPAPEAPEAAPFVPDVVAAPAAGTAASRPAQTAGPQLPTFLRGFDPTVPLTALLVLALLVAGVGSALRRSSHGAATPAASLHTLTTAPTPLAVNTGNDQKLAQSLVLDQNDFPDGWTLTPHTRDPADEQDSRNFAACIGRPDPATVETADVDGADGNGGGGLQAGSNITTTHTEQQARDDLAAASSTKATECFKRGAADSLGRRGVHVVDIGVGRYSISTANIPSVALHLEVLGDQGGARGLLYVDEVFMQEGRIEAQASFASFNGHFPLDIEQTLVTRLAHKVAGV